jgi:polyphosphate kinase
MPISSEFINRDLSWLTFNDRVLAQAEDAGVPLLERVKFLAIFSSNLDEFFMKRVGLLKLRVSGRGGAEKTTHEGITLGGLRHEIRARVDDLQARQAAVWAGSLLPALAEAGIRVRRHSDLTAQQRADIDAWFNANVFPILTPLAVDPSHRFPFISNLSENFGLLVSGSGTTRRAFARVKIPSVVPRFVPLSGGEDEAHEFLALDDLIEHNLGRLFPGLEIHEIAPFRVTRSAALDDEDDDDDDVMERVEDELRRRRFADAVRIEAPEHASDDVLQFVVTQLGLDDIDVFRRAGPAGVPGPARDRLAAAPRPARDALASGRADGPAEPRDGGGDAPRRGRGPAPGRFGHAHLDDLRRDPRGRHPAAPPLRVVRGTRSSGSSPRPRTTRTSSRSSRRSTAPAPIRRSCAR